MFLCKSCLTPFLDQTLERTYYKCPCPDCRLLAMREINPRATRPDPAPRITRETMLDDIIESGKYLNALTESGYVTLEDTSHLSFPDISYLCDHTFDCGPAAAIAIDRDLRSAWLIVNGGNHGS